MKKEFEKYLQDFDQGLKNLDYSDIHRAVVLIKETIDMNRNIFVIGNGGSIATSIHFSEDILLNNDLKVKVHHLSNISVVTAIGNDWGYPDIFVKQLENLYSFGDLLITISASGNSENLVKAIDYVQSHNGKVISISSFHGGVTKRKADVSVYIRTDVGNYEIAEDLHLVTCHIISKLLKEGF